MAKNLKQWCIEKNKSNILSELDMIKNNDIFAKKYIPDRVEYNSPSMVNWICKNGHQYRCEIVARTKFGLNCPVCGDKGTNLPIKTKYGCLTIIDYDRTQRLYKCKCDCGKEQYLSRYDFLKSKHRFCTCAVTEKLLERRLWGLKISNEPQTEENALKDFCGLAVKAWKKKNEEYRKNGLEKFAINYDIDFVGKTFESLEILECIDERYEEKHKHGDKRKKNAYTYTIYKLYKCRCYLCGKEHIVKCSQFSINPPTQYGPTAYNGYWSGVQCNCHDFSSFQWMVNKILIENDVPYKVEFSFPDLYGACGKNKLKFDFAIFNNDGTIKYLIECQGEQHYAPIEEFGGERGFKAQKQNDELKKEYVKKNGFSLIEIHYKNKKIEEIESILQKYNII